eukprot:m.70634 g.70634  ORF g.70634 m.70634 type:complete len:546 (-) comp8656_c1_seq2:65-1702(-)
MASNKDDLKPHDTEQDEAQSKQAQADAEAEAVVDEVVKGVFDDAERVAAGKAPAMLWGIRVFVIRCLAITSLTSILLGYDIGIWGAAHIKVQKRFDLTDVEVSVLVGILNVTSAVGGLFCGWTSERLGRRKTVATACVLFIIGSIFKCFAQGYGSLMTGRTITGVGVGVGMAIAPMYGAELAPKKFRGGLVTLTEISINLGIFLGYALGYAFSGLDDDLSWRLMLAMGAFPPFFILLGLHGMPDSPRWLVKKNRELDAALALSSAADRPEAEEALKELRALKHVAEESWSEFIRPSTPGAGWLLVAGIGTAFMQQASGIEAQVYYTPEILESAGMTSEDQRLQGQMLVGAVKLLFIGIPLRLLDHPSTLFGRVNFLIASGLGMAIGQIMLACNFLGNNSSIALALSGQCVYMAFFSLGYGPITWVLTGEVFPLRFRGKAMGVATFTNRVMSGMIAMLFPVLAAAMTTSGVFFLFAVLAVVSSVFAWLVVPETKGRSLEEIEQVVAGRKADKLKALALRRNPAYKPQEDAYASHAAAPETSLSSTA